MMRLHTAVVVFALLTPSVALGQDGAEESNYDPPIERRGGVVIGLLGGIGVGSYSGYPNEVDEINEPDSYSSTGAALGNGGKLFLGGALRDWFTVSVAFSAGGAGSKDLVGSGGGLGLHLEGFPLFALGGSYRDLGLSADFGPGGATVRDGDGNETANGGFMSSVGAGAFFEPWQLWQFSHGPVLSYNYQFSRSLDSHLLLVGWRLVFYSGQP